MLSHLSLRNFVIIERLELELDSGMTVLTGETGAGKSILVDALGLAVGERASATMIRAGADRAEVVAVFELAPSSDAHGWLRDHELDTPDLSDRPICPEPPDPPQRGSAEPGAADGAAPLDEVHECVLRRTIGSDGRSRASINERPVPVQTLRDLGDLLVDIHGQHAHQSLLRPKVQRDLLDAFGEHGVVLSRLAESFERWQTLSRRLAEDAGVTADRHARLDFLRYQVDELDGASPSTEELGVLESDLKLLSHATELATACEGALALIDSDSSGSAHDRIAAARRAVGDAIAFDARLEEVSSLLESALVEVSEASSTLRRYLGQIELEPRRLEMIDERLAELHQLARKHRVPPRDLEGLHQRLRDEIDYLEHSEERLADLEANRDRELEVYRSLAGELHRQRAKAAERLAQAVSPAPATTRHAGGEIRDRGCRRIRAPPERNRRGLDRVQRQPQSGGTGATTPPSVLRGRAISDESWHSARRHRPHRRSNPHLRRG